MSELDQLIAPTPPPHMERFVKREAPKGARMMAAKGMVPLKGVDLLTALTFLCDSDDAEVAGAASDTLCKLPKNVLASACASLSDAWLIDRAADCLRDVPEGLEVLLTHANVHNSTVERFARTCSETLAERLAENEKRLLAEPRIIEALYKNRNTRMSTADRLVELCARNGVQLRGIAAFKAHAEAISGQLLAEPGESLPSDDAFRDALAADREDLDAVEMDANAGVEEVKPEYRPLRAKINDMSLSEKIRLAQIGTSTARALLVRDANRTVAMAAIGSPHVNESEATVIAQSKQVSEEILRYIGHRREWLRSYEIKRALLFNPKTPAGVALTFVSHLREHDLRRLTRSRNIPTSLRSAATQLYRKKLTARKR